MSSTRSLVFLNHVAAHRLTDVLSRPIARLRSSPIGYRLAQGVFWSFSGSLVSRGLNLLAFILVARVLGKIGFGEFGIIQSTLGMFAVFAGFGLGLTANKHVAEYREKYPDRAGRIIALSEFVALLCGGITALALALLAPWLATHTLSAPHLAGALRVGAILLFLNVLTGAQNGTLAGFEAFRAIALRSFWSGLAAFPLVVAGVYIAGLIGAVWGLLGSAAINWLLNHLAIRREARRAGIRIALDGLSEWPVLWKFSLPATLGGIVVMPVIWICHAMLIHQANGYAQMGTFNAASAFPNMLSFMAFTMTAPLLPLLASQQGSASTPLDRVNMLSTWFLGVMPALPLIAFPAIGEWIFGEQYRGEAFRVTLLLAVLTNCIILYKQGLARVLAAKDLMWWGFLSNGTWAVALLISSFYLVRWGAAGLALGFLIAYVANTVVFIPLYTWRRLVPKGTIVSVEAGIIWLSLIALAGLSFAGAPLWLRLAGLGISTLSTLCAFYRLNAPTPRLFRSEPVGCLRS